MAYDLDQARSIYSLDRTGFRELMSQQALGRNLAHAALISEDGSVIIAAKTDADFDMPQAPPEWVASATSGQPVLIEPNRRNLVGAIVKMREFPTPIFTR